MNKDDLTVINVMSVIQQLWSVVSCRLTARSDEFIVVDLNTPGTTAAPIHSRHIGIRLRATDKSMEWFQGTPQRIISAFLFVVHMASKAFKY